MKNRYLFFAFLAFIFGILFATLCDFSILFALIPLCVGLVLVFIKKVRLLGVLSLVCAFSLFYSGCLFFEPDSAFNQVRVKGKVVSYEQTQEDYRVLLEDCEVSSANINKVSRLYVYCESLPSSLKTGNTVECFGDVLPIICGKHANPGTTNYRLLNQVDGIFYLMRVEELKLIDKNSDFNYQFLLLRNKIRQHIYTVAPSSNSASVLYAMITADRQFITTETSELFSSTGTSHLLAVSGLHINILVAFIAFFLEKIKCNKIVSLIVLCVFLVFYAFFTGFSPSVLRSGIMALTFSFALNFGKRYDSVNILGLAGILILILNPFILFEVSFQLSFLACFGIFVFIKYQIKTKYKVLNALFNSCLITFGATLFTLPLQVYYFGKLPLFSIFANLIVVPLASFSLMLGFMFLLLSFLFNPLGILIKIPCFILECVLFILKYLKFLPSVTFKTINLIIVLIVVFVFILLTRFFRFKKKKLLACLLIVCLLFTCFHGIYSLNFIKLYVPESSDNLCAHVEGRGVYVFGVSGIENYLTLNAPNIDCLFLLNEKDIKALDNLDNINIDKIYLHPDLNQTLISVKHKATHLLNEIQIKDGLIYPLDKGFVFENGNNSFFIGNKCYGRIFTAVVSNDSLVRGKTAITKGVINNYCKNFYDIKTNGYTYLIFRRYNEPYRLF